MTKEIIVFRGAKEICAVIGEDYRAINRLVSDEGLPAWRRRSEGIWRALPDDLEKWVTRQRDKYITEPGAT